MSGTKPSVCFRLISDPVQATNDRIAAPNKGPFGEKIMLKIKLIATLSVLFLVGMVFQNSHSFSTSAKGDVLKEIANYKTWTKISKEPIEVKIAEASFIGG